MSNKERQAAYRQIVQAFLECSQNDEERILANNHDLVDEGLVKALKDTAKMMMIRNNPALGATIQRLVSFAQQLERKLVAVQSEIVELEQEDYIRFSFELLKIVADSQGDGEIVHQFFDRHLAYLNVDLLTVFSQSIEALLEREKNRYWQADIASVLHNLAIDLQTYPRGDRSINFALSIACKERSLLVRTQPDEQILQGRGCTKDRSKTEIFEADRDRQTAYFELVQELIQCPLNDEDRILTTRPELVDKGLVIALLEVADIRKEHNHPDSASTIEWLESFADKLNQKLELQIETNQQPDDPRFEDFLLDLLQTVDRSQGNRQIVHQFLDEHLAYLSNNLLTILPQSIEALLSRQKDPDRQADLGSILDNLAIDLQTYSSGDRSINLALSIACKEGALLCRSQLDESRERGTTEIIEADIDRQTAYLNLVQLLIQCPLNDEDRVLASYPELVDKRLVTALLEVAETSKKHNNPDAASTIEWLESFAEQLDLKLDLQQGVIQATEDGKSEVLLEEIPTSQTDGEITHQFTAEKDRLEIELDDRTDENDNLELELDDLIVPVVIPTILPIDTLKTNRDLGQMYFQQGEWQLAAAAYEIAMQAMETSPNWVVDEQQRQEVLDGALSIAENALQCAINLENYPQAIQATERSRRLNSAIGGQIQVATIDYAAIPQLIHSPHTAILTCYTTKDDTHIFIIKQSGAPTIHTCQTQGQQKFHNWLQKTWINPCHQDNSNWAENLPRLLHNIAQRLELNPLVEQHLTDINELIIVPHLNLQHIPFAALPLTGGGLLGDRFIIRSIPSLQSCQLHPPVTNDSSPIQSTLWSVDDYLSVIFNVMYQEWRNQNTNRAAALRIAQSRLRNLTGAEFHHHYYPHAIEHVTKHHPALKTALEHHLEPYCQMDKPFESPYYWASFITQGMT